MTAAEKDDGNAFPVDDEDREECKVPKRKKNKSNKSIALAISDEPSLPPKARAKSFKSDKPITESMGTPNFQPSPSVGCSSTTRVIVKTTASEFSSQLMVRTKPTISSSYKSNFSDPEPDKDSSLSVDLIGTKTTGISPSTIGFAVPPSAAQLKSSSATDKNKAPTIVEADLCGDGEESLFSEIESLLRGDSGKENTGTEMSGASQFDLQAYHEAMQEVADIMSLGLPAITNNPKLLGHLQKSLNFLVKHNRPEVSTVEYRCVYLKLQDLIQSAGDSLCSQQKILVECERFERKLKMQKYLLAYDKDDVLLLNEQVEKTAKSVADNEQVIAKLQAEIEARKLTVENAKSELSSLLTERSEKVKELENEYKQVRRMVNENTSMEKGRNQAQEIIDEINAEWNELYADIKGRLAS